MTDYKVEFYLDETPFMKTTFEKEVFEELKGDEKLLETEESYGKFHERVFEYEIKRLDEINSYEIMRSLFRHDPKKGYKFLPEHKASKIDDLIIERKRNGELSREQIEEIIEDQINLEEDLGSFKRKKLVENVDVRYKQA